MHGRGVAAGLSGASTDGLRSGPVPGRGRRLPLPRGVHRQARTGRPTPALGSPGARHEVGIVETARRSRGEREMVAPSECPSVRTHVTFSKPHRPSSEGHSCVTTRAHRQLRRCIQAECRTTDASESVELTLAVDHRPRAVTCMPLDSISGDVKACAGHELVGALDRRAVDQCHHVRHHADPDTVRLTGRSANPPPTGGRRLSQSCGEQLLARIRGERCSDQTPNY